MPDRCCVTGCRSNYDGTDTYVSVFKFPKNSELRELWIRKIPRTNLTVNNRTVVCAKHFQEESIIRFDELPYNDGSLVKIPRSHPKIHEAAYPTIFPGCPAYLSEPVKKSRLSRNDKMKLLDDATMVEFHKHDSIETFDVFTKLVDEKLCHFLEMHKNLSIIKTSDNVFMLFFDFISVPKISKSVKIQKNLDFNMYHGNQEISKHHINHILDDLSMLVRWSQLENILNFVDGLNEPMNETEITHYDEAIKHWKAYCEVEEVDIKVYDKKLFLLEQLLLSNKGKMARRYSSDIITFAYSLYMKSTNCYMSLYDSKLLTIPSVDYLKKILNLLKLNHSTSSESNSEYVKGKFSKLGESDKIVNLLIDEIHVKKNVIYKGCRISGYSENNSNAEATSVQAFMISSIFSSYKEVIGLVPVSSMTTDDLFSLTLQAINLLERAGFTVVCLISDNNRINRNMFEKLGKGNITDFIKNPANENKKLFLLFDSVHLLKSIRNNWLNQNDAEKTFICPDFEDDTIQISPKFSLLRKIFNLEKNSIIKYANHLNFKSLYPSSIERQNVNLAVKVFHESNCAALEMRSAELKLNCKDTINFLQIIKKWWDIMNISHARKGLITRNIDSVPFRSKHDPRLTFLKNFVKWLEDWRNLNKKPRCGRLSDETFFALRHTTATIILVLEHMLDNGAKYVLTAKFQTDNLESKFSQYRQMSGGNYHVSVQQLIESERKLRLKSVLQLRSNQLGNIPIKTLILQVCGDVQTESVSESSELFGDIFENFDLSEISEDQMEILTYISGYCVHKLNISCLTCKAYFQSSTYIVIEPDSTSSADVVSYSNYLSCIDRGALKLPSENVLLMLSSCFLLFQNLISEKYESTFMSSTIKQHSIIVHITMSYIQANFLTDNNEVCCECKKPVLVYVTKLVKTFSNICLNNYTKVLADRQQQIISDHRKLKKFKSSVSEKKSEKSAVVPHICNICQMTFTKAELLKKHSALHTGEKPYICEVCQKNFSQKQHLKKHSLTHSTEKLHVCEVCQKSFSQKQYLTKHSLIHSGEKPHACDVCSKRFSEKNKLKRHYIIHTCEKPHICNICEKSFSQKQHLKTHSLTHTL